MKWMQSVMYNLPDVRLRDTSVSGYNLCTCLRIILQFLVNAFFWKNCSSCPLVTSICLVHIMTSRFCLSINAEWQRISSMASFYQDISLDIFVQPLVHCSCRYAKYCDLSIIITITQHKLQCYGHQLNITVEKEKKK